MPRDAPRRVELAHATRHGQLTRLERSSSRPLSASTVSASLGVRLQHLLPKRLLTSLVGRFARARAGRVTTAVIRWFVRRYGVQMHAAAKPDVADYATFNDFFTRALRPGARTISDAPLVCPVDGAVSECGAIDGSLVLQAKGQCYATATLLGGDTERAARFENGSFATIYLSPRDYHRIHMPCDGRLVRMAHVPGSLFSVNPATVRGVPGLFARNERVVCHFEGSSGPFVIVLVGATIVGSVATVWHGVVTPPRSRAVRMWDYPCEGDRAVTLDKGAEMGRFLLGSTVILLFPPPRVSFNSDWNPGTAVRMGSSMAEW